jgi:hypothetical protein
VIQTNKQTNKLFFAMHSSCVKILRQLLSFQFLPRVMKKKSQNTSIWRHWSSGGNLIADVKWTRKTDWRAMLTVFVVLRFLNLSSRRLSRKLSFVFCYLRQNVICTNSCHKVLCWSILLGIARKNQVDVFLFFPECSWNFVCITTFFLWL